MLERNPYKPRSARATGLDGFHRAVDDTARFQQQLSPPPTARPASAGRRASLPVLEYELLRIAAALIEG